MCGHLQLDLLMMQAKVVLGCVPMQLGGSQPPAFVDNDYFCSSGNKGPENTDLSVYDNPLWSEDQDPKPFSKDLPGLTIDDLELRICTSDAWSQENVLIDTINIYVH